MAVAEAQPLSSVAVKTNGVSLSDGEVPAPQTPTRTNGVHQNGDSAPAVNGSAHDAFELDSKYAYTPRKIRVITIGAGFSGLLMAHKFQHRFPEMKDIVEHKIFEARSDVGGTWRTSDMRYFGNHYLQSRSGKQLPWSSVRCTRSHICVCSQQ